MWTAPIEADDFLCLVGLTSSSLSLDFITVSCDGLGTGKREDLTNGDECNFGSNNPRIGLCLVRLDDPDGDVYRGWGSGV
jgi:hypothetical protein